MTTSGRGSELLRLSSPADGGSGDDRPAHAFRDPGGCRRIHPGVKHASLPSWEHDAVPPTHHKRVFGAVGCRWLMFGARGREETGA